MAEDLLLPSLVVLPLLEGMVDMASHLLGVATQVLEVLHLINTTSQGVTMRTGRMDLMLSAAS